jgi:hypothetical protein
VIAVVLVLVIIGSWAVLGAAASAFVFGVNALLRRRCDRIEALIDATREPPDYVPDTWVKEHGR